MKRASLILPLLLGGLVSCQQVSRIRDVSDLPLKTLQEPSTEWEESPMRAHSKYILFDAKSPGDKRNFLGDYYFVNWYDAEPDKPVKLVMQYTQSRTTRQVQTATIEYKEPRSSAGRRKDRFTFNGPARAKGGDILSWRIELIVDGEVRDSRQSYLWE